MQARGPGFVHINDRKVKVQQWMLFDDRATLTTLVHGDAAGTELLEQLRESDLTLSWEDHGPIHVRPALTHHRIAGSGPTTVHRIEVTLWFADTPPVAPELSPAAQLDQILQEIRLLRAEVAELRAERRQHGPSPTSPLAAGQTLLDFDIDTDGED